MEKYRLIITGSVDGARETIIFSDDLGSDAYDFVPDGETLVFSGRISAELPGFFPLNSKLKNEKI